MLKQLENILRNEIDPAFAKRARFIFKTIEREKPERILDAGCGRCFYVQALLNFGFIKEIHGIDINEKYLNVAKANIAQRHSGERSDSRIVVRKASIYSLPYPDDYFDFIICSEVLEHLKDDKKALAELKRVLKFKGTLIITVPNYNFPFLWDPLNWILMRVFNTHINKNIWWLAGIWADHERLYKEKELRILFKKTGFQIKKLEKIISWSWPFSQFFLYGIGKNLVERLKINSFNRFNFNEKKYLSNLLADLFMLPSNLIDSRIKMSESVNIVSVLKSNETLR